MLRLFSRFHTDEDAKRFAVVEIDRIEIPSFRLYIPHVLPERLLAGMQIAVSGSRAVEW